MMIKKTIKNVIFCKLTVDITRGRQQSTKKGAVVAVIVWYLQLPLQSVPITTDVASSNLDQGEVYKMM